MSSKFSNGHLIRNKNRPMIHLSKYNEKCQTNVYAISFVSKDDGEMASNDKVTTNNALNKCHIMSKIVHHSVRIAYELVYIKYAK